MEAELRGTPIIRVGHFDVETDGGLAIAIRGADSPEGDAWNREGFQFLLHHVAGDAEVQDAAEGIALSDAVTEATASGG